jgi:hypothetical protein
MRCQPCSSHSGSWLVYTQQKLEESPISPLRMSPFHVFFLLILVSSLPRDPQVLDCGSCMNTTWAGNVTKTLAFHTYYSCAGTVVGSCPHNHTTYLVCSHNDQYICFNPICCPREQWLEVQSFTSTGELITGHRFTTLVYMLNHIIQLQAFGFGLLASLRGWGMWKVQSE